MSIYISGVEMPPAGTCKTITIFDNGTVVKANGSETLGKAISVPEHGDLIDRDEYVVKLRLKRARCGVGYTSNAITMCMNDANDMPTIIPADKEGEG